MVFAKVKAVFRRPNQLAQVGKCRLSRNGVEYIQHMYSTWDELMNLIKVLLQNPC